MVAGVRRNLEAFVDLAHFVCGNTEVRNVGQQVTRDRVKACSRYLGHAQVADAPLVGLVAKEARIEVERGAQTILP